MALGVDHFVHHLGVGEIAFVHSTEYRSHKVPIIRTDVVLERLITDVAANPHVWLPLNQCMKKSDATDQIEVLFALNRSNRHQYIVLPDTLEDGPLLDVTLVEQRLVLADQLPVVL